MKWGKNFKVNNETNAVKTSTLYNIFLKMYELKSLTIINEYIVHALPKFEMDLSETAMDKMFARLLCPYDSSPFSQITINSMGRIHIILSTLQYSLPPPGLKISETRKVFSCWNI